MSANKLSSGGINISNFFKLLVESEEELKSAIKSAGANEQVTQEIYDHFINLEDSPDALLISSQLINKDENRFIDGDEFGDYFETLGLNTGQPQSLLSYFGKEYLVDIDY
ncbi:MAG: hypothetical protein HRT47_13040 [Candidatus Caenarcaniphilales bacterium]|nr:hypothetical protein [Candidatus Caenarcaniphilales bacterium]